MSKLTAAQMTADLPMAVERNATRRLTRRERLLLCRLIDVAWGFDELRLDTGELVRLADIQKKLRPNRRRRRR